MSPEQGRLERVLESTGVGVWELEPASGSFWISDQERCNFLIPPVEALNGIDDYLRFVECASALSYRQHLDACLAGETVGFDCFTRDRRRLRVTLRPQCRCGEVVLITGTSLPSDGGDADELFFRANYDGLTKLPNRSLLTDRLGKLLQACARERQRFAVAFLDLDRFKWVNDVLGHRAGDELLVQAAQRIAGRVRASDTLARLGGDEFCILLPGVGEEDTATAVVEPILHALAQPFSLNGEPVEISASIGVAFYPQAGESPFQLLRHADVAMYRAKFAGRGRWECYRPAQPDPQRRGCRRDEVIARLGDELELNAEWVVAADDRSRHGLALELACRGVPLKSAEVSRVLEDAACQGGCSELLARMMRDGVALLSAAPGGAGLPLHLDLCAFTAAGVDWRRAQAAVGGYPVMAGLSEAMLVEHPRAALAYAAACREAQVPVMVTGFGVKNVSFAVLAGLGARALEIDPGLTRAVPGERSALEMVDAIVSMAAALGMDVIAAGVTNEEQAQHLAASGCRWLRGPLFSATAQASAPSPDRVPEPLGVS